MAVADVSAGDEDPIGTSFKPLEDKIGVDPAGAHDPDNPHVGRVLETADPGQVGSRIGAPITGKGENLWTEISGHVRFPAVCWLSGAAA